MEGLLGLLGMGTGGLLTKEAFDALGEAGELGYTRGTEIGNEAASMSNFTGYGVTGPTGSATVGADGNTAFNLNAGQQNYADANLGASMGMMSSATGDTSAREGDIYNRIRATQMPEEERAMLDMESRMAAQGRTGLSTAAYGGAPEQLAMQKAIAEARNSASLASIGEARAQQGQDANLSQLFGQMQYAPQAALQDTLTSASQGYGYKDVADRQGASLFAEGATSGLDALLASRLGQANLMGELGTGLIGGSFGMLGNAVGNGSGIPDSLSDILGILGIG